METYTINITEINGMYAMTIRTTKEDGTVSTERLRLSPKQVQEVITTIKVLN
jgi:hypothetical protein